MADVCAVWVFGCLGVKECFGDMVGCVYCGWCVLMHLGVTCVDGCVWMGGM